MDKDRILESFSLFSFGTTGGGIGALLNRDTDDQVFQRLSSLASRDPLSLEEFNQLLLLAHEASISHDFFTYYWLTIPEHPYDVTMIDGYDPRWSQENLDRIVSIDHLKWGLYRVYVDGLLYFGNVRTAFRRLRTMDAESLRAFFLEKRFNTQALRSRGPALPLRCIAKDKRHFVSEMACQCFAAPPGTDPELKKALLEAWGIYRASNGGYATLRDVLDHERVQEALEPCHQRLSFIAGHMLEELVRSESSILDKYEHMAADYEKIRDLALRNTQLYLSMVNDMDVYVATSMRSRSDFFEMADFCDYVFSDQRLKDLNLRYFDPTLSVADGREDKGLIECLMVKCAKALVYCAGEKESFGKDAEAAMALSLGKPVIFYCKQAHKKDLYRDMHPLTRLIEFQTGVAVGAMVTDSTEHVQELLARTFQNKLQYKLQQYPEGSGYLRLEHFPIA